MGYTEQCNNVHFLFWGYWFNGSFTELGSNPNIGPDSNAHQFCFFRLTEAGSANWHYRFDGGACNSADLLPGVTWAVPGVRVQTGLESSNTATTIPAHWFSTMQLQHDEGTWVNWGANAGQIVDPPFMCGGYPGYPTDLTKFSAAENAAC